MALVRFLMPAIKRFSPEEGLQHILDRLRTSNLTRAEQDLDWVRRFVAGIKNRTKAIQTYRPRAYDGVITLFRSSQVEPENAKALLEIGVDVLSPSRGWDMLSSKPLDVHFFPGYHATLLKRPHVEAVGRQLM